MKKIVVMLSLLYGGCVLPTKPPIPVDKIEVVALTELITNYENVARGTRVICRYATKPYVVVDDTITSSARYVTVQRNHTTWWGVPITNMQAILMKPLNNSENKGEINIVREKITPSYVKAATYAVCIGACYGLYQLRAFAK